VELFFQQLLNGLTIGGVYSLVALGLTLVYGILHVPNFAHGAFYMTGAFAGYYLMAKLGVNYWLSMAGAAVVVAGSPCWQRLVFRRHAPESARHDRGHRHPAVPEAGAQALRRGLPPHADALRASGRSSVRRRTLRSSRAPSADGALPFLNHTVLGSTIIAMAQNRDGAAVVGATTRVTLLVFAISAHWPRSRRCSMRRSIVYLTAGTW
jgi:branched-chain amino acid transport system permease protein